MCRRMATTAMTTLTGVPCMCGNAIVSICVMLKKQRVVLRVLKYLPVHSVHSREALRVDMHSDVGMLADSHILCHSLWLAVHCLQPSFHRLLDFTIMLCQSKCVCVYVLAGQVVERVASSSRRSCRQMTVPCCVHMGAGHRKAK